VIEALFWRHSRRTFYEFADITAGKRRGKGGATARPGMHARPEADLGIAAVVAVGMTGVQKIVPGLDDPWRDRCERPSVERVRLDFVSRTLWMGYNWTAPMGDE